MVGTSFTVLIFCSRTLGAHSIFASTLVTPSSPLSSPTSTFLFFFTSPSLRLLFSAPPLTFSPLSSPSCSLHPPPRPSYHFGSVHLITLRLLSTLETPPAGLPSPARSISSLRSFATSTNRLPKPRQNSSLHFLLLCSCHARPGSSPPLSQPLHCLLFLHCYIPLHSEFLTANCSGVEAPIIDHLPSYPQCRLTVAGENSTGTPRMVGRRVSMGRGEPRRRIARRRKTKKVQELLLQ